MQANYKLWVCLLLATSLLQGCMNAAVTGAQAVYNRSSIEKTLNDHVIVLKANQAIYADKNRFKDSKVSVTAFNNVVLITGQVQNPEEKRNLSFIVKRATAAKDIYNLANVGQVPTVLTQMSDAWITTKIKSQLLATLEVDPTQIKVVTENGTVYLMGIIPPEQAQIAVSIARTTAGVQNVVKIFSYIRITKT